MAQRVWAVEPIYDEVRFKPGDEVKGVDPELVEDWLAAGVVTTEQPAEAVPSPAAGEVKGQATMMRKRGGAK